MTQTQHVVTAEGLEKLQAELHKLKTVDRTAIIKRIADARALGDLSENADYHDAREQQSFIEGRIQEVEMMIKNAVVVKAKKGGNTVGVGSKVTVVTGNNEEIYEIVGSNESDPLAGKISSESPVGSALVNRAVGDTVTVTTPAGSMEYKILKIE